METIQILGLYRDYFSILEKQWKHLLGLYGGHTRIMGNKMEMETALILQLYMNYIGIMESKMETTLNSV